MSALSIPTAKRGWPGRVTGADLLYGEPVLPKYSRDFADADFHQSFFVIHALARYGREPAGLLAALLAPGKSIESPHRAGHMEPLTEADRLQRLRSYGLREVRERLTREPGLLTSRPCQTWWPLAAPYAQKDPSLDVAIEAAQVLKLACSRERIRRLISHRSERDQNIIGTFLEG